MSTYTVEVTGMAPTTTESSLHEFFSFCGSIQSISLADKKAVVHFEKPGAAKTALLLNGGVLDGANLTVTSETVHQDEEHHDDSRPIDQSDKPRAGIVAEYLAKGYKLSDHILTRAIEMDNKQGISKRFLNYMQSLDKSMGERALGPDKTISSHIQTNMQTATQTATVQMNKIDPQGRYADRFHTYYTKALSSPLGQKVLSFYTSTSKQVKDIHEEATRIAAAHKAAEASSSSDQATSTTASEEKAQPKKD